jgi:MOSC domain-containing protein YiiM
MNTIKGTIVSINISEEKGRKKLPVQSAECIVDKGIKGDVHGTGGIRQISFLSEISVNKMRQQGIELDPGDFAENITFDGFGVEDVKIGDVIDCGSIRFEVTKIGKECHDGCWIKHKVGDCIMPREGFFVKVVNGGTIKENDEIILKKQ